MRAAPRALLLSVLSLALGLGAARAQDGAPAGEPYVRMAEGSRPEDGALQTAVARFRAPGRDVTIVLYGVVHIADAEFYAKVQRDLDSYTTVLFEGVGPGREAPTEADKSLSDIQKTMGEMLGLTFQKDGIDYTHQNLVHADMNMDELKQAMGGGSISPLGQIMSEDQLKQMAPLLKMFAGFGKMLMAGNPQMRDQLKHQMAGQMANQDMSAGMGQQMTQAILYDRNRVCFEVLSRQLESQTSGTIAIFYGAAHMPDMEKKLGELGFSRVDKRWMSAWQIGAGVNDGWEAPAGPGGPPARAPQPAPAREPSPGRETVPPTNQRGARWF
jgi:hypothetical protein